MKYMLDTNICIYLIKRKPETVIKKFKTLSIGDVCISSITFSELVYGIEKSEHYQKNKSALEEFVLTLDILAYDDASASHYGFIRAYLEKKGQPIGSLDLMIAAHARSTNSVLVTNNVNEFFRIPDLRIENWVYLQE